MLALLLLLQSPSPDLIVTGQRLVEAQTECARGGCTPLRDAQATIALAEEKFRTGGYVDAKQLLSAAIKRNEDKASVAPRPVAALYEAMATVSLHEGDQDDYRHAVAKQVDTLRNNLPADDPAVLSAVTALGDMWIKLNNYPQAESTYQTIEREALAQGRADAAMLAGMRRVWLTAAMKKTAEVERMMTDLEQRPIAQQAGYKSALQVLRLRIASQGGDDAAVTKLSGEITQSKGAEPVLIFSPPYGRNAAADAAAHARSFGEVDPDQIRGADLSGIQWIDVGFWIRPDGNTADVEILRGSRTPGWAPMILNQISGRRYAVRAAIGADDIGTYRVERVSRKSAYMTPKGSLIRRRVATSGFETLDLTNAPEARRRPPT